MDNSQSTSLSHRNSPGEGTRHHSSDTNWPTGNDVTMGIAGCMCHSKGNRQYHQLIEKFGELYTDLGRRNDRHAVALHVYETVHSWGGRFMRRERISEEWIEADEKYATKKIKGSLGREALKTDLANNAKRELQTSTTNNDVGVVTRNNSADNQQHHPSPSPRIQPSLVSRHSQPPIERGNPCSSKAALEAAVPVVVQNQGRPLHQQQEEQLRLGVLPVSVDNRDICVVHHTQAQFFPNSPLQAPPPAQQLFREMSQSLRKRPAPQAPAQFSSRTTKKTMKRSKKSTHPTTISAQQLLQVQQALVDASALSRGSIPCRHPLELPAKAPAPTRHPQVPTTKVSAHTMFSQSLIRAQDPFGKTPSPMKVSPPSMHPPYDYCPQRDPRTGVSSPTVYPQVRALSPPQIAQSPMQATTQRQSPITCHSPLTMLHSRKTLSFAHSQAHSPPMKMKHLPPEPLMSASLQQKRQHSIDTCSPPPIPSHIKSRSTPTMSMETTGQQQHAEPCVDYVFLLTTTPHHPIIKANGPRPIVHTKPIVSKVNNDDQNDMGAQEWRIKKRQQDIFERTMKTLGD